MKRTKRHISRQEEPSFEGSDVHEDIRDGLWSTHQAIQNQKETVDYRPRVAEDASKTALPLKSGVKDYHRENQRAFTRRPSVTPQKNPPLAVFASRRKAKRRSISESSSSTDSGYKPAAQRPKSKSPIPLRPQDEEELQDRPKITPYRLRRERDSMYRTERSKDLQHGAGKSSLERREEKELQYCTFRPATNDPKKISKGNAWDKRDKLGGNENRGNNARKRSRKESGLDVDEDERFETADDRFGASPRGDRDPLIEEFNTADENDPGEHVVGRGAEELLKWGREKDSKLAAKRVQAASSIEKECTFNPKINPRSSKIPLKDYIPPDKRYNKKLSRQKSKNLENEEPEHLFRPKINEKSIEILKRRQMETEIQRQAYLKEELDKKYLQENLQNKSFYSQDSGDSREYESRKSRQPKYQSPKLNSGKKVQKSRPTTHQIIKSAIKQYVSNASPMKLSPTKDIQVGQVWRTTDRSKSKRKFADNGMPILNTGVSKPRIKEKRELAKKEAVAKSRSKSKGRKQENSRSNSRPRLRDPRDEDEIKRKFRNVGDKLNNSLDRTAFTAASATNSANTTRKQQVEAKEAKAHKHGGKKICEQPAEVQDMPLRRKDVSGIQDLQTTGDKEKENRSALLNKTWIDSGLAKQHQKRIHKLIYPNQPFG